MGAVAWQGGGWGKGAAMEPHVCTLAGVRALRGSLQAETAFPEALQSGNGTMKDGESR